MSAAEQALALARRRPEDLLAVVGPTASGKTSLALLLAEELGGEIVSADSVQIYRRFDAGSGKPTAEEMARAPHHFVSLIEPTDAMDAATWAAAAGQTIDAIRARGSRPIVCGGTFLWVKALVHGLAEAPAADAALRAGHRALAESEGRSALHARLIARDPAAAARLHPNDFVRVSRALEVTELTGRPMSEWQREHAFSQVLRPTQLVAIATDPAALTARIEERVHGFIAGGLIEEVESLVARGFGGARAMGSVGYAQVRAMLHGKLPRGELEVAMVRATRVFARRQRTWLNRAGVTWLQGG